MGWLKDTALFQGLRAWRKRQRYRSIEKLPSRVFMQTSLLSALAKRGCRRMFSVGAQSYNLPFYRDCGALDIGVWSMDYDPLSARYGAPQGHFVGDVRQVDTLVAGQKFDVIILNGIFGFGINTKENAVLTIEAIERIAAPGAVFVVGWNPGLTSDAEILVVRARLKSLALVDNSPAIEFPPQGQQAYPHRYEFFSFAA